MIVGFGLGSMIGVAAGLFHMINNALYKSGLFLCAGSIEYRTGSDNIEDTGGLSKAMPLTFFSSLIFAMSISGIPPLNGFASKWMIYQGIIDLGSEGSISGNLWVVWLGLAVLGSALTMASFVKFIGGIFLGRRNRELENIKEVPVTMWLPQILLAIICIFFGVFATNIVVPKIIMPVSGSFVFDGIWNSSLVSLLVLVSIILGVIIYLSLNIKKFRSEDSFIGGEKIQEETNYPVTEFYNTIKEFRFFSWAYSRAGEKWFDVYDLSKRSVLWLSHQFSEAHTGVLTGYIIWAVAGLILMLLILI
jgi:NADH:ubiquinone oxidoreductase subunit 5 (subunit L)/multisubunit Na+/H+ antiporter MnhA subunit